MGRQEEGSDGRSRNLVFHTSGNGRAEGWGNAERCYIPFQPENEHGSGREGCAAIGDATREGCEVSSRKYPAKGALVKRKEDGLAGQVYVSSPTTDLVAVRWQKEDETGTLLYDIDQFAREWEPARKRSAWWKVAAASIAIVALCGIGAWLGFRAWEASRASGVAAADRRQADANARSPDDDGVQAERACSRGADEYLRSIASDRFRWAYGATPDERFSDQVAVHVAPGITTSVSDKLLLEDSTGVFKRVELVCSYDSENNKVLRFWIAESDE